MGCSTPGSPVFHDLAQIHAHWISYAIQPSHPLPPPFPFALLLSQHLFFIHLPLSGFNWQHMSLVPHSSWDLSSPTRDGTCIPRTARILNHLATSEAPTFNLKTEKKGHA